MTIRRLLIVLAVLVIGLGSVIFLPKVANSSPQGIELALPSDIGRWHGEDQPITERELQVLAKDTAFARKVYTDGKNSHIFVSIVMSGQDLDNSIHRPERCLPAQGWSVVDSKVVKIPVQEGGALETTRLHNVHKFVTKEGVTVPVYGLNYYWFVGWKDTTASHLTRTYIDIRDRIFFGYNQRWAYITVAARVMEGLVSFGRSEKETDAILQDFIQQLVPQIQRPAEARESTAVATR